MGRRSVASHQGSRPRWISDYENREYGFETISGEIDRALMTATSHTSSYLQELVQPHESSEILISDSHGRCQPIEVNEFTNVAQACLLFDPQTDLCNMQLYEEVPELSGFGESIRHNWIGWVNLPQSHISCHDCVFLQTLRGVFLLERFTLLKRVVSL
ncbi:unnamed protein product [Echinostoma caproni]|uniref:DUF3480 domain-containing protein n=1 Tax=Echinostoma caproni TaxID=27848 RepID=A0A183B6B7_9TREM|nr:unnamed protein product [Echinostoma caproni]